MTITIINNIDNSLLLFIIIVLLQLVLVLVPLTNKPTSKQSAVKKRKGTKILKTLGN